MTIHDLKKTLPIFRKKLDNGLETVILPIRKVPVVTISVGYKAGSKNEVRGKTGLAHLFEHLMFEGTANVPKGGFDQYCSIAGGTNNAYTTYDLTSYIMALPSHQLELGLWLESDRMFNFEIGEKALENQKKVVVEEINQTVENQPYGRWRNFLAENAFAPESCYSWEVQGFADDVKSVGMKDINDFYEKFYQPENACLVIAGDIDPGSALPQIEKYFNQQVTRKEIYRPPNGKEMLQSGNYAKFEDNVPFHALFLAFHCSGFKDEEILAGDVLAFILGSGKSSILYNSQV